MGKSGSGKTSMRSIIFGEFFWAPMATPQRRASRKPRVHHERCSIALVRALLNFSLALDTSTLTLTTPSNNLTNPRPTQRIIWRATRRVWARRWASRTVGGGECS
jgi:hypothetical protein